MTLKQKVKSREVRHLSAFNNGDPPADDIHGIGPQMQQIQTAELSNNTPAFNMPGIEVG